MPQILLAAASDDELFAKLCAEVRALGGTIEDSEWVQDGSNQVTTYTISLPQGKLAALVGEQVGLSLRGPKRIVSMLAQKVVPRPRGRLMARLMSKAWPRGMRNDLRRGNREGLVIGGTICFIGFLLLATCIYLSYSSIALLVSGHRAVGVVMAESCHKSDCTSLIQYTDIDGVTRDKTIASSNLSSRSVDIAFRQRSEELPTDVSIITFGMMWTGPLFLAFFGLILSYVGLGLFVQHLPPSKKPQQPRPSSKRTPDGAAQVEP